MSISALNANALLAPDPKGSGDLAELFRSMRTFVQGVIALLFVMCAWWRGESEILIGIYIQAVFAALLLMWVCGVGIVVERSLRYWNVRIQSRRFTGEADGALRDRSLARVVEIAGRYSGSPSARVMASGLESFLSGTQFLSGAEAIETAKQAMRRSANAVHREMQRGLWLLATIAASAPLVGLYGTVVGILNSFHGCGAARATCMAATFVGLEVALWTTVFALFVAVPTLWCHKYLSSELEAFDMEAKNQSLNVVNYLLICVGQRNG